MAFLMAYYKWYGTVIIPIQFVVNCFLRYCMIKEDRDVSTVIAGSVASVVAPCVGISNDKKICIPAFLITANHK